MERRFDHLGDVEALHAVVDAGSFTAAARTLGTTPSALSRAVERLERRLGVQLLRRTTRRLALTDGGVRYLDQSRAAFALIADAERELRGQDARVAGRVRISLPTTWGHHRAPARLAAFRVRHPEVTLEIAIGNRNVDLVAEGFDMAVRLGRLPDSGLIARHLEDAPLRLVASPAYAERRGLPRTPEELDAHDCIPFVLPSTGRIIPWLLRDAGGRDVEHVPPASWRVSEDVLGCVHLAEAGAGIAQIYDFIAAERLRAGALVEVLPQCAGSSRPFSLIYPAERHRGAAARALVDFLVGTAGEDGRHPRDAAGPR